MKIKIVFDSDRWFHKSALDIEAVNMKVAVESAVKEGANLGGANLGGANLRCANLGGANLERVKWNARILWAMRPVLQLGCCGSVGRTTLILFFEDGGDPEIHCGCFTGNIEQFEAKIHETHGGTFYEYEYMAMVEHIKAIRKYQLETKEIANETH